MFLHLMYEYSTDLVFWTRKLHPKYMGYLKIIVLSKNIEPEKRLIDDLS